MGVGQEEVGLFYLVIKRKLNEATMYNCLSDF